MNTEGNIDGTLSFGTAVDMSGFDEAQNAIMSKIAELGEKAESQGMELHDFISKIPAVDLASFANIDSLDKVKQGFENISYVMDSSRNAIKELESEYDRLGEEMDKAFKSGKDEEYAQLDRKRKTIKELIALRTKLMETTDKVGGELSEYEAKLKKSSDAQRRAADELKKAEPAHTSMRQRIRELKDALVEMEAAGQRNTDEYRRIQAEAAKLTDAWADATHQATILAHDQRGMQGVISGLSGVSGAFTAAQGAVSLFSGENEELQKVMLKVQSLMAITMGLQQVQAALDKDSAFRLVTLNGLKELWNKLVGIGIEEQGADIAVKTTNTAVEDTNTAATNANTKAKKLNANAAKDATVATGANTAGDIANTGAATGATVANKGLAASFRKLGAAIATIPLIGAIAVGLTALIKVISSFVKESNKASEAAKEQRELMKGGKDAYIEAKLGIENYISSIESFNGTAAQEKKLISELNSKYGEQMGYYKSLAEWKDVLVQKGDAYCKMMQKEAEVQALVDKYKEAYISCPPSPSGLS